MMRSVCKKFWETIRHLGAPLCWRSGGLGCLLTLSACIPVWAGGDDSLLQAVRNGPDSLRFPALIVLSTKEETKGRLNVAYTYARSANRLARQVGKDSWLALAYARQGGLEAVESHYPAAERCFDSAFRVMQKPGFPPDVAGDVLLEYSMVQVYQSDFRKSIETNKKALAFFELARQDKGKGFAHLNMGNCYSRYEQMDAAVAHYLQAIEKSRMAGEWGTQLRALNNLGTVYQQTGNYRTALDYFRQMEQLSKTTSRCGLHVTALQNMASAYQELSHFDSGYHYAQQSLEQNSQCPNGSAVIYGNLTLAA